MSVLSRDCFHVLIGDASDHAAVSLYHLSASHRIEVWVEVLE